MGQGNKSLVGGGMVEEGVDTFLAGRGGEGGTPILPVGKTMGIYNSLSHSCVPVPHVYGREGGIPS